MGECCSSDKKGDSETTKIIRRRISRKEFSSSASEEHKEKEKVKGIDDNFSTNQKIISGQDLMRHSMEKDKKGDASVKLLQKRRNNYEENEESLINNSIDGGNNLNRNRDINLSEISDRDIRSHVFS